MSRSGFASHAETSSEEFDDENNLSGEQDKTVLRYEPLELDQMGDSELCEFCQEAINESEFDTANSLLPVRRTLLTVRDGGVDHILGRQHGCDLCEILLRNRSFATISRQFRSKAHRVTTYAGDSNGLAVSISFDFRHFQSNMLKILLSDEIKRYMTIPPLPIPIWNERSTSLARYWLQTCRMSHKDCQLRLGSQGCASHPTRLIDIGVSNDSRPKLCLGSDLLADIQYFTLSHCWGMAQTYKLLQANLSILKSEGIELRELSKTFRQAIEVTRELGGRYIWIDSLCIIQDSIDDWRSESALMAEVYSHSTCNIAASAAKDGSKGLFCNRDPFPVKQIRVYKKGNIDTDDWIITDPNSLTRSLDDAPLSERGWVFQERILSPCTLHFSKDQIIWECRQLNAAEVFPNGDPCSVYRGFKTRHEIKTFIYPLLRPTTIESKDRALLFWEFLIRSYSKASLTYQTDKLVAISGIARAMKLVVGDRYLAGTWESQLLPWLLWQSSGLGDHHQSEYVAPSWSWVSDRKGALLPWWSADDEKYLVVQKVDCRVCLSSNHPFGQLKHGSITLRGQLAPIQMKSVQSPDIFSRPSGDIKDFYNDGIERIFYWDYIDFKEITSQLESLFILIVFARPGKSYRGIIIGKRHDDGKFFRYGLYILNVSFRREDGRQKAAELYQTCADFYDFSKDHDISPLVCEENGEFLVTIY